MDPKHAVAALAALWLLIAPLPASSASPLPHAQDPLPAPPVTPAAWPDFGDATRRTFLPLVGAPSVDVRVDAIEITQAVQSATNDVPLVAGRPTVARVFLKAQGQALTGLTVSLSATRGGVALAGSPMVRTGATARTAYSRSSAGHSVNFLLPAQWLSGSVVLTAQVALPNGRDGSPANNTRRLTTAFRTVAPLAVTVVPVRYTHAPSGRTYAPVTSVRFPTSVRAMFPVPSVQVRLRAPISFRGDLTYDSGRVDVTPWQRLLEQSYSLKLADGAPGATVYAAIPPGSVLDNHRVYLAGLGSSSRVVVAFDIELIPAHELGHALGRRHAPCGNPSGVDPAYPYAGARVGVHGYDTARGVVYDPSATTDLMSYCEEWVSDYTYMGMMENQLQIAALEADVGPASAAEGSVLVRALIDDQGAATLLPFYRLAGLPPTSPATNASPYSVAFVTPQGDVAAEYPVELIEVEEHGQTARLIAARLPAPATAVAGLQLRQHGSILAVRPVRTSAPAAAASLDGGALQIAADGPVLLQRRSGTGGATLAVDLVGGESLPLDGVAGGEGSFEMIPADVLDLVTAASPLEAALPDSPPVVWLGAPVLAPLGAGVVLDGYASDAEDGTLEITWLVDGAPVAVGPLFQIEELAGPLTIEARAADSAGQPASASITLAPVAPTEEPNQ